MFRYIHYVLELRKDLDKYDICQVNQFNLCPVKEMSQNIQRDLCRVQVRVFAFQHYRLLDRQHYNFSCTIIIALSRV